MRGNLQPDCPPSPGFAGDLWRANVSMPQGVAIIPPTRPKGGGRRDHSTAAASAVRIAVCRAAGADRRGLAPPSRHLARPLARPKSLRRKAESGCAPARQSGPCAREMAPRGDEDQDAQKRGWRARRGRDATGRLWAGVGGRAVRHGAPWRSGGPWATPSVPRGGAIWADQLGEKMSVYERRWAPAAHSHSVPGSDSTRFLECRAESRP